MSDKNKKYANSNKQGYTVICFLASFILLSIMATACNKEKSYQAQPPVVVSDSAKNILFIGNSLTYYNDLPKIVTRIAKDNGIEIKTEVMAFPNYALEDHWNDGKIQTLIASGKFNFVVVQQGPSSQAEGRAMLLDYGARIKNLCTANNTQLAFFMVWPAFANFNNFDGVIRNYTDAATATNSLLCPVGKIWKEYFVSTGDYSYYGSDMFHPSQKGSESAAEIIFKTLFK